ncbi:MAG: hypothetical protein CSA07_05385 [Bacteroidia bacterium]|nr:MAG: hypothetical protein CSA07_05385 [Bacteroidia bacterium]
MQTELMQEVSTLGRLVTQLLERETQRAKAQAGLIARIRELEQELRTLEAQLGRASTRADLAQMAASLGPDSEDARTARELINQIVSQLDKSLELLRM